MNLEPSILAGESQTLEFKASFDKTTVESLVAFAQREGVNGGVSGGVSGGVNGLLSYVQLNPGKRAGEMAVAFKLTQRTIERWLKQLKVSDAIEFRGAPKTGGYFAK